jgi:hypothetical protein
VEGLEGNASSVTLDAMWAGSGGTGRSEERMAFLASVCLFNLRNRMARFPRLLEEFVHSDIVAFDYVVILCCLLSLVPNYLD